MKQKKLSTKKTSAKSKTKKIIAVIRTHAIFNYPSKFAFRAGKREFKKGE
jgi:hypothetical protein